MALKLRKGDIFSGESAGSAESQMMRMAALIFEALERRKGPTVATAESCTGGIIGAALTSVSGISEYYLGGFITYSNEMKQKFLGVKKGTLHNFGAVSEETAREMASGAAGETGAGSAIAVTGIAGPKGGSVEKPVGLVCFGFLLPDGSLRSDRRIFRGGREAVRKKAALYALRSFLRFISIQG